MFQDKLPAEDEGFGSGLHPGDKKKSQILLSVILIIGIVLTGIIIMGMVRYKQGKKGNTESVSVLPVHGHTAQNAGGTMRLSGILYNRKGNSVALITEGESVYTVREGEALGATSWKVESITENQVILTDGLSTKALSLTEEEPAS